jgi:hypothetical protein
MGDGHTAEERPATYAPSPWHTSSFSGTGNCVEVRMTPSNVLVRDTKDPGGPILCFTPDEWQAFLQGVRASEFDLGVSPLEVSTTASGQ